MAKLLNSAQAAERLGISVWSVQNMVRRGRLRPVRLLEGKLLFTEQALEEAVRLAQQGAPAGRPAAEPALARDG
jgi:excisionase family DNA binding protein